MYKNLKIAVVVPAYNEERLITKTVETLPESVDYIIAVNDASTDNTIGVLKKLEKQHKKLIVLDNENNGGIGYSLKRGFKYALDKTDATAIGIVAGDAQCDPNYIQPMLDELIDKDCDYIKANRFFHRDALKAMPKYRKMGNIFISLLTKFSTGYYKISDTQNGYGFFRSTILEKVDFDLVRDRYDYENSMLVALSIADASVHDYPVPAIYGEEKSTIKFWRTAYRALRAVWVGFWQRIYHKYIFFSFHPIALFIFSGLFFCIVGISFGIYMLIEKLANNLSPSTGTVMLSVLPFILGFQLLLTALIMDVYNENH